MAKGLKLRRNGGAPILITGRGKGTCSIPAEFMGLPRPTAMGNVGATQRGRGISIWFWLVGEGGQEIRAAVCATLEIWSEKREIYHFDLLLTPEDFSSLTFTNFFGQKETHLGVGFRDRAFEEFTGPPSSTVNVVVRVRLSDGTTLQSGETLYVSP